jgi:hypothetical protein
MTVKMMKSRLAIATLAGVAALAGGAAVADTGTVNATIDVITPTAIRSAPGALLDFGQLVAPTDQDVVWTMTPTSLSGASLLSDGSDSIDLVSGDHRAGAFYVTAESGYTVYISTTVVTDFSAPGLSLSIDPAQHVLPASGQFTMFSPYAGFEMPIVVGGALTITTDSAWGENAGGDPAVVEVSAHY